MPEPLPEFAQEAMRPISRVREGAEKLGAQLKEIEAGLTTLLPAQWDAAIEERFGPMLRSTIGSMNTLEHAIARVQHRGEEYLAPLRRILADKFGGPDALDNVSTILVFHAWSDRMLTFLLFTRFEKLHPRPPQTISTS